MVFVIFEVVGSIAYRKLSFPTCIEKFGELPISGCLCPAGRTESQVYVWSR